MRFSIHSHRMRIVALVCYVLLASSVVAAVAHVQEGGGPDDCIADLLVLDQSDVPVKGYWASGSPTGITRSDGVYIVAETYVKSDPYKVYGGADLHKYVDIKIEVYADQDAAYQQYNKVDRLFGTPVSYDGREYLKVDIERGVGIAYYTCCDEMCIGFVTNDSESVLQKFITAFWRRYERVQTDARPSS